MSEDKQTPYTADHSTDNSTHHDTANDKFDAKSFLSSCSQKPGVYQMFDAKGKHLYIGKAKNLKKRLSSYFRAQLPGGKTEALV